MFKKVLIANRGEIAVRIISTCKRLKIGTVAVYSEADAQGLHVRMADEAVLVGGAHASESYLSVEALIKAAVSTGSQAVHPGYGFLSESDRFAQAVADGGLVFIGPPPATIRLLGHKIEARRIAAEAGVPIIPGYTGPLATTRDGLSAAESIGYPVLIKPAAGGGGKGMRIVTAPGQMAEALSASRQEARKAFGDEQLLMEKFIEQPRHIEIQVLADRFGNVVHLGERECSIQRRYQKVIEESPSLFMTEALRGRMVEAACELARKTGYVNAGTVEFVADARGDFFFLEMNTRLQVEHPVTEFVTGLDLVEQQLLIAAGQPLGFGQQDIAIKGWAIEARVCAEDPGKSFLPSTGMITRYAAPRGEGVRVDSGIDTGSVVSIYYDSMLAKVICHGPDREAARLRLVDALNGYHIEGVITNVEFANSILCHPAFIRGALTTGFIETHFKEGRSKIEPEREHLRLLALAATLIYHMRTVVVRASLKPMVSQIGGCSKAVTTHPYHVRSENVRLEITLECDEAQRRWTFRVDKTTYSVETPNFEFFRRRLKLKINGAYHRFRLHIDQSFVYGTFCGIGRVFEIYSPREWEKLCHMPEKAERRAENVLLCPMPGLVVAVFARKGDRVFKGQTIVTVESMKMESGVASPHDGRVVDVFVKPGQAVEAGMVMIQFGCA